MKKNRGLTMAEMMVSMVVLFLVGVFVMDMFVGGSRQLLKSTRNEKLSSLLRAKCSEVEQSEYADLDGLTLSGNFAAPDDDYSYRIVYSNFQSFTQAEARIADITIQHPDLGQRNSRIVRSAVPEMDPGQVVFEKFGCTSCHALPAAGYAASGSETGPNLDEITNIVAGVRPERPYQGASPSMTFEEYVQESILDPNGPSDPYAPGTGFDSVLTDDNTMSPIINIEGIGPDPYDAATDMSSSEIDALTSWLRGLNGL